MPRIRAIKPEFPDDEKLGRCSRDARYLFVLLWTKCDDHGRFRASPTWLRSSLYPYDDDIGGFHVEQWLLELERAGVVRLYTVEEEQYGDVPKWEKHQRIDNASRPLYPAYENGQPPQPPPTTGESRRVSESLGDSPQPAAGLGESPLSLQDQERDQDLEDIRPSALELVPPEAPSRAGQSFEQWWAVYPRHEAKAKARAAFEPALKRAGTLSVLVEGAQRYRDDPNREKPYTKLPTTWLRGDCWLDDPLPNRNGHAQPSASVGALVRVAQRKGMGA